uniref:Uncharacterized protein n=1 Tax=Tanacetum cinerariifolium TaxID=118510 RepID=A0A699H0X2_TANCI|nr:hypothetical protein [Tanacetum cinerariifolium]
MAFTMSLIESCVLLLLSKVENPKRIVSHKDLVIPLPHHPPFIMDHHLIKLMMTKMSKMKALLELALHLLLHVLILFHHLPTINKTLLLLLNKVTTFYSSDEQFYSTVNNKFMKNNGVCSRHLEKHLKEYLDTPKITIISPRKLFIDLTQDNDKTLSPQQQTSSPSAPSKTPSTKATSSSSIGSKLMSPNSSPFYSTSPPINDCLNLPNSPPLIVPPPPPTQDNESLDITLTLSPITPLDFQFNYPSPSIPSPPILGPPIPFNLLEAHGASCLCCLHNRTLIFSLRDELHYMFSFLEYLLFQPSPPNPFAPTTSSLVN